MAVAAEVGVNARGTSANVVPPSVLTRGIDVSIRTVQIVVPAGLTAITSGCTASTRLQFCIPFVERQSPAPLLELLLVAV